MVTRGVLLGALLVGLPACVVQIIDVGDDCAAPDHGHLGANGNPDPCHRRDAADAGDFFGCADGEGVKVSLGWDGPTRLWFGPEGQAPDCPYGPLSISYEGHADLVALPACEACTCEPPTGSCALPSKLTASTHTCGDFAGGALTSFDAPTPWDGSCDNTTQTPSGAAHALTIGALTMTENGCASGPPVPAKVLSWHWDTFARACDGRGWSDGALSESTCIPRDDPTPPGFQLCIFRDGEQPCPDEPSSVFTQQHFFYKGVKDDRQCSACSCGPPAGSACTATISIYKGSNLTCAAPALVPVPASSQSSTCIDIQLPGQSLGSKSAGPTTYLPGACEALGGQASGAAVKIYPSTLCCRP